MRLGNTRSASALAALGVTVAAAIVALGPPAPAGPTALTGTISPSQTGGAEVASVSPDKPAEPADIASHVVDLEQHHLERSLQPVLAAGRRLADEQAVAASAMLESVKAARTGAVEQATRNSERAQIATASPRELGQILAAERGFSGDQWSCLDSLWQRESNWNPNAENPSSGAYGIPQSLPGSKMATVAADWRTNPATQITWGLNYITDRYGTPCGAWGHSQSVGWY
ncbi:MAG: transglycosylase SLT domain-containing protein [Actinomycetes bacterium]